MQPIEVMREEIEQAGLEIVNLWDAGGRYILHTKTSDFPEVLSKLHKRGHNTGFGTNSSGSENDGIFQVVLWTIADSAAFNRNKIISSIKHAIRTGLNTGLNHNDLIDIVEIEIHNILNEDRGNE